MPINELPPPDASVLKTIQAYWEIISLLLLTLVGSVKLMLRERKAVHDRISNVEEIARGTQSMAENNEKTSAQIIEELKLLRKEAREDAKTSRDMQSNLVQAFIDHK